MFIESYEFRTPTVGGNISHTSSEAIPYPAISDGDWEVWTTYLPVRTEIEPEFLAGRGLLAYAHTLPSKVRDDLQRANRYFDKVEVWGHRQIEKDPIAVGYRKNTRYLIARWGMAELLPFPRMKKYMPLMRAHDYAIRNFPIVAGLMGFILLCLLG